jgi:hypothetical protein
MLLVGRIRCSVIDGGYADGFDAANENFWTFAF